MRYFFTTILVLTFLGCSSQKDKPLPASQTAGPRVQNWLNKVKTETALRLPVIVTSKKPLADSLLRQISPNHYTARLTQQELKTLLKNPNIKKITTGKEKLH